jgi:phosphoesterase RecJ-like protein
MSGFTTVQPFPETRMADHEDSPLDWKPLLAALEAPGTIVLTSHVSPDGDALGSEAGLALWLTRRGRRVRVLNADPVPDRYDFLGEMFPLETIGATADTGDPAAVVVLDVSRWDRLGAAGEALAKSTAPRLCIDHHPGGADFDTRAAVIAPDRAATGELLFEMMDAAGDPPRGNEAAALYVAILTDTGSFRYANTSPRTHRIAARLIESGVDPSVLYDLVYSRSSVARHRLFGEALLVLETPHPALVTTEVTRAAMDRVGATTADTEGLSEYLRATRGCRAAAVFTEAAPGRIKVSLRSRGTLDVNAVARRFGGGGHVNAAGIPAEGTLADVRTRVTAALVEALAATPE